jgi:hypothetical protein
MALGRQIINLMRPHLLNDTNQARGIGQIPIMQSEIISVLMGIMVQMVNTIGIEK